MKLINDVEQLTMTELEGGMEYIRQSPRDQGVLKMIVRRPNVDEREVVVECELDLEQGLAGDSWKVRGSSHTSDGSANVNAQLTIMNSRVIALLAQDEARWPLAGDQLYIDMDLSDDNIPPGTRLALGSAVIEVSDTGRGIPASALPYIFERFYRQTDPRDSRVTGFGLGLAISKWIADAHGGSIEVDSREDQGTRFTVRLPLAQSPPGQP